MERVADSAQGCCDLIVVSYWLLGRRDPGAYAREIGCIYRAPVDQGHAAVLPDARHDIRCELNATRNASYRSFSRIMVCHSLTGNSTSSNRVSKIHCFETGGEKDDDNVLPPFRSAAHPTISSRPPAMHDTEPASREPAARAPQSAMRSVCLGCTSWGSVHGFRSMQGLPSILAEYLNICEYRRGDGETLRAHPRRLFPSSWW